MAKKKKSAEDEEMKEVQCLNCGHIQTDMGMGSECEECDDPMPTYAPGAKGTQWDARRPENAVER